MKAKYMSDSETAYICKAIASLLHSGLSAGDSVYILAEDFEEQTGAILIAMGENLDKGYSLYYAFEQSGVFAPFVTGMINAGEKTGKLEEALAAVSLYYDKKEHLEAEVKNALMYPLILMLIMAAVVLILIIKVLPLFDSVYAALGSELTGIAGALLDAGLFLGEMSAFVAVMFAFFSAFVFTLVLSDSVRGKLWRKLSMTYADKGSIGKLNYARIASVIAMAVSSGLDGERTLILASELMKNMPLMEKKCIDAARSVAEGESFIKSVSDNGLLPAYACRMLDIGMKSGNADTVAESIAERLMDEALLSVEEMVSKIEPVMVLAASLIIGVILLLVMVPLINIMTAIG